MKKKGNRRKVEIYSQRSTALGQVSLFAIVLLFADTGGSFLMRPGWPCSQLATARKASLPRITTETSPTLYLLSRLEGKSLFQGGGM